MFACLLASQDEHDDSCIVLERFTSSVFFIWNSFDTVLGSKCGCLRGE